MEWRDIKGFEGYYQVSEYGDVRSIRRNRNLKPKVDKDGYFEFCLCVDDVRTYKRGHRLVAEVFVENPKNDLIVNHLDNNKQNNHYSNLEWCDFYRNVQHGVSMINGKRTLSHLDPEDLLEIVDKMNNGVSYKEIISSYKLTIPDCTSLIELKKGRRHGTITGIKYEP